MVAEDRVEIIPIARFIRTQDLGKPSFELLSVYL